MPKRNSIYLTKQIVENAPLNEYTWDGDRAGARDSFVRGFGVRVTKGGTRTFIYRYRFNDTAPRDVGDNRPASRQRFDKIGNFPTMTVEQARAVARKKAATPGIDHRGEAGKELERLRRRKTVADLETLYLGDYARERSLRPNTVAASKVGFKLIPAMIKAMAIEDVTKADVRKVLADAHARSGPYQANRLRALLSKTFKLARENDWIGGDSPCMGAQKYPEDQRWRYLSEAEVDHLMAACDAYDAHPDTADGVADAVRLLLFTGARLREVLHAEWVQFDLEAGVWEKPSAHTKTKLQHRLRLEGVALEVLKSMRETNPTGKFLFPGEPAVGPLGQPIERPREGLRRAWDWIREEAGLENVRLHDLRRTLASFMVSGGATMATVGKTLGHTQASTTHRYAKVFDSVQQSELKAAGDRMLALKGKFPKAKLLKFSN